MVDEEKMDITSDQSSFAASQAVLQAPPIPLEEPKDPKNKMLLLAGMGLGILFLVITLIVLSSSKKREIAASPTPVPSATPKIESTLLKQQLEDLSNQVSQVNPDEVLVAPPQVDMEIEF